LGKNNEAIQAYETALRLFPDYAEVHNNYGNLLVRMGRVEEALPHFEQAIQITPDYSSAWNNFGTALQRLGRTNGALEHFQKAVTLDTNYWQAQFNLANSFFQRRQWPEARAGFESVLGQQPQFAPAKEALARLEQEAKSKPD
jgi:tetratricopeptide (TPR) repeat protein